MKRFLKWFIGIIFFLIIAVVGLVIALPYLIDPNEYKADIIAQIKPHMRGRDLQIPGDIKISVLPWLGFEIGKVVIGNADGFVLKPFMTIDKAKAHVKLLSLFSDTPEIGSLEFSGIDVSLQRDAEGRNNWSDLANADTKAKATPPASTATKAMALPLLKIEGLHFNDVTIWLEDKQAKDTMTISKLNIDAGPIDQLKPIPIKGKFNFHSKKSELASASAFAANLIVSQDLNNIQFDQFVMNTNISGAIVNNKTMQTSLKIPSLNINLSKEAIAAKPFYLKLNDMDSEGRLNLHRFENPVVRLGWEIKKLDLDALLPAVQKPVESSAKTTEDDLPQIQAMESGEKVDTSVNILAPLAAFKNADLQGTIKIGELRVHQLDLTDVKVNLLARGGLVSALPEAKLYGGTYKGDLQIQTRLNPPQLRSKQELRKVPIGPILKVLYGKESVTGDVNFQGQFFSEGTTQDTITSHLNGDGQFNIANAQLKTLDMKQLILGKWYDKAKFVQEKQQDKEVTAFESMRGTLRIKAGVVHNKDFMATSQRINLSGEGYTNLNTTDIKYTMMMIPQKSFGFSLGAHTYDLKNKRIPTYITGTWAQPKIDNDIEKVFKEEFKQSELYQKKRAAEDKLKEKLKIEEEEKLKEKLKTEKDKLKDKLKGVFQK